MNTRGYAQIEHSQPTYNIPPRALHGHKLSDSGDEIDRILFGRICDLIMKTASTVTPNTQFLYETAIEIVFSSDKPIRMKDLYDGLGQIYGKTSAAVRNCMNHMQFLYDNCVKEIECMQNTSKKAFDYMRAEEFVAVFRDQLEKERRMLEENSSHGDTSRLQLESDMPKEDKRHE